MAHQPWEDPWPFAFWLVCNQEEYCILQAMCYCSQPISRDLYSWLHVITFIDTEYKRSLLVWTNGDL